MQRKRFPASLACVFRGRHFGGVLQTLAALGFGQLAARRAGFAADGGMLAHDFFAAAACASATARL
jgi:hypothetical protein